MSVDPSSITIQKTRHSILISQPPTGTFSKQDFEYLLRTIRFAHDPLRPPVEQYSAFVSVSVDDGVFRSDLAFTMISVSVTNTGPAVLIDGQTNASAVMFDGEPVITLFGSDVVLTLFEDSSTIQAVSITLTNPRDGAERIRLSPSNIPSNINITMDGSIITLTGPASPVDFSQALTDSTIHYEYPAMESILQGDRPEFTTRYECYKSYNDNFYKVLSSIMFIYVSVHTVITPVTHDQP